MSAKKNSLVRTANDAIVLACLIFLLHDVFPVNLLDQLTYLLSSASSFQVALNDSQEKQVVVIGIEDRVFEDEYGEKSPLDRCIMRSQLARIYQDHPAVLVIDFDLSPSLEGINQIGPRWSEVRKCETDLYALITASTQTKTVLLQPYPVVNVAATQAKKKWWRDMECMAEVSFGDGFIPIYFGMAEKFDDGPSSLARVIHAAAPPEHDNAGHDTPEPAHRLPSHERVNFRAFAEGTEFIQWSDWLVSKVCLCKKIVFFGASYGEDDKFLTPLGDFYGVHYHAAAYLSVRRHVALYETLALVSDAVIGFGFALLVHWVWHKYIAAKSPAYPRRHEFAFLWLLLLAAGLGALLWLLAKLSVLLIARHDIWISPLPMVIGMSLDAFVIGAVKAVDNACRGTQGKHDAEPKASASSGAAAWVRKAKQALCLAIILFAIYNLLTEH